MSEKYSNNTTPTEADTERQLLVKMLTRLNNISGTGGGGSDFISIPGPPSNTPGATDPHIVVDSNGQQWQFYQNGWH